MLVHGRAIELALSLLAAHLVGDFVLQTAWMVREKARWTVLAAHCGLIAALSYLFAGRWSAWPIVVAVGLSHALIDRLKMASRQNGLLIFTVDQCAHLAVIGWIASQWSEYNAPGYWNQLLGNQASAAWAWLAGLIGCVRVGGFVVGYAVQPYLDEIQRETAPESQRLRPTRGLTNGGRVIGQWERSLIFLFVGLGQPASIGFLIAAKSVFRFGELKDRDSRMEAEYITIGTLMSFAWAIATSYLTWHYAKVLLSTLGP